MEFWTHLIASNSMCCTCTKNIPSTVLTPFRDLIQKCITLLKLHLPTTITLTISSQIPSRVITDIICTSSRGILCLSDQIVRYSSLLNLFITGVRYPTFFLQTLIRDSATGFRDAAATALTSSSTSCRPCMMDGRTLGNSSSVISWRDNNCYIILINTKLIIHLWWWLTAFWHYRRCWYNRLTLKTTSQ